MSLSKVFDCSKTAPIEIGGSGSRAARSTGNVVIAYFDCFSGASGDMILGACIDAGVPLDALRDGLSRLSLGGYAIEAAKIKKQGFAATKFDVKIDPGAAAPHRHLKHILQILEQSTLAAPVQARASKIFLRLAEAEARAHGSTVEKVHFHEVGAVDAIVDVVGACLALDLLGVTRVVCSPIPTGSGTVRCDHGVMPVPAPGTAALLEGVLLAECDEMGELTTPTGAAILTTLAESYGPLPAMICRKTGYGAGTRDGKNRPNLLRLFVGEPSAESGVDEIDVLEANVDDASAEVLGYAMERVMEAGALDAYCVPVSMKKTRLGTLLTVLCEPARTPEMEAIVFAETTTLGIRRHRAARTKLERRRETVTTPYGPVSVKVGLRDGQETTISPEYEDCRAAAKRSGVPLREVMAAAVRAWNS